MDIIVASKNRGKIEEIKSILNLPFLKWHTFGEFKDWPDLAESADTYRENALAKAKALIELYGMAALADDSGLEVDALQGKPGPLSARFAGAKASDEENVAKLLRELAGVSSDNRSARFRCWIALVEPSGAAVTTEGVCEGSIAEAARGTSGFGYDPVFVPLGQEKTFAELPPREKNSISHRGIALRKMREEFRRHHGI
jgi:XTP/dITP diphosphohydrolase